MQNETKVDVLAVMKAYADMVENEYNGDAADMREARAAVAELIEAAKRARYSGYVGFLIPALKKVGHEHPMETKNGLNHAVVYELIEAAHQEHGGVNHHPASDLCRPRTHRRCEMSATCAHEWRWIETWEGDPGVIGGTREVAYWRCSKCWAEDHQREAPDDENDDANDWMGDEP